MKCQYQDCDKTASYHICEFRQRAFVAEEHFCAGHLPEYMRHRNSVRNQMEPVQSTDKLLAFDIRFLGFTDERVGAEFLENLFLEEIDGRRQLCFDTGYCEASAIYYQLRNTFPGRLSTQTAMSNIVRALGGNLEDVVVSNFEPPGTFQCQARIRVGSELVTPLMRPSDGFALALACGVPILVSGNALAKAAGKKSGG